MSDDIEVSPEEVKDFLEAGKVEAQPEAPATLTQEEIDALGLGRKAAPDAEAPKKLDSAYPPGMHPEADNNTDVLQLAFQSDRMPKVEVTQLDRRLFLKAVTLFAPLELDIDVAGGIVVRIRSLTEQETSVVISAAELDARENEETAIMERFVNAMQNYSLMLQVCRLGNVAFPYQVALPDGVPETDQVAFLRARMKDLAPKIQGPSRALAAKALQVFHIKYKLCIDNLPNPDFWKAPISS